MYAMGSFALYPMGFYELQPEYECRHFDSNIGAYSEWYQCKNLEFCPNFHVEDDMSAKERQSILLGLPQHRVNEESHRSLHNWVDLFQL